MTSPENPGRDGYPRNQHDLDDQAVENRLRIRTDYLGSCVVIGVAGEIDIATAGRLRMQVIIAVLLAAIPPSVVMVLLACSDRSCSRPATAP